MYEIKKRIYLDLDKTQKSALCNFLRALVKQNLEIEVSDLFDKFVEDEEYYLQVKASRFPFLAEVLYVKSIMTIKSHRHLLLQNKRNLKNKNANFCRM